MRWFCMGVVVRVWDTRYWLLRRVQVAGPMACDPLKQHAAPSQRSARLLESMIAAMLAGGPERICTGVRAAP